MGESNDVIAKCRECGEWLLDGDTAYKMSDAYYCPGCVADALVVCRHEHYYKYSHDETVREDD